MIKDATANWKARLRAEGVKGPASFEKMQDAPSFPCPNNWYSRKIAARNLILRPRHQIPENTAQASLALMYFIVLEKGPKTGHFAVS
jgi:hypothetical protein